VLDDSSARFGGTHPMSDRRFCVELRIVSLAQKKLRGCGGTASHDLFRALWSSQTFGPSTACP
jgi:hypothetical protein